MCSKELKGTVFPSIPFKVYWILGAMGNLSKLPVAMVGHLSSCWGHSLKLYQGDSNNSQSTKYIRNVPVSISKKF